MPSLSLLHQHQHNDSTTKNNNNTISRRRTKKPTSNSSDEETERGESVAKGEELELLGVSVNWLQNDFLKKEVPKYGRFTAADSTVYDIEDLKSTLWPNSPEREGHRMPT